MIATKDSAAAGLGRLLPESRNYYFLAAGLEDLRWGHEPPRGTLEELLEYLRGELHPDDKLAMHQLFLMNDMRNAVAYHGPDDQFVSPSCYRRAQILEAAQGDESVLPFLIEFFENTRNNIRLYPDRPLIDELTMMFYDRIGDIENGFVRDYFIRELDVRNLAIALSRERQGFPYRERLIPRGEVYDAISAGSPPDFGLSAEFPFVDRLTEVFSSTDLTAHEQAMETARWEWLDERVGPDFFSTEFILSYVVKYQSMERWNSLSEQKGDEVFGELVNAVQRSVRFALEFTPFGDNENDEGNGNGN